jgi:signal transduction histidine kinase
LVQIFDNLIVNALKYGCERGETIEVGGERNGEKVSLYVRDHGPGIPIDEQGRIFEVFCRGVAGKDKQGTGIGLATVQKIASLFDGRAWVEDTPGGGSTFWVDIVDVPD